MTLGSKAKRSSGKVHVAVLNSHPIQYFAPLYRFLHASNDISLTALYATNHSLRGGLDPGFGQRVAWDIDLLSGYHALFVGPAATRRTPGGFFSLVVPEIWREVRSGKYDVLWLHGHSYAMNLIALLAAKSRGMPVLMRSETHLGLPRTWAKRVLRSLVMRVLYSLCDCCLPIGTENRRFYESLGVAKAKLHLVPYAVDNDRLEPASRLSPPERATARSAFGLDPEAFVILYVAKFSRRKHPEHLLRAVSLLKNRGCRMTVLMVGSGELEASLRELAQREGIDVVWAGFRNQSELPPIYGLSDVFVLPSEGEPWGLAVNEAMCAGLPIIATDSVGCAADLIQETNGFTYPVGDIPRLAAALERVFLGRGLRARLGADSRRIISHWSYRECLVGLRSALDYVSARQELSS
jgi:glycosyltransferase involved in cell wall biosynthesis